MELKENAKPYHANPFPISKTHKPTLKKEADTLIKIGVLKKINNFYCVDPAFVIPKKNGTVRFISDFKELNKRIKRNLFQSLIYEGFRYAASLDIMSCISETMHNSITVGQI